MSEDHDWVRRLLADAGRSPEPMPPDVADRLDRVLDELAAEPGRAETDGAVVPMTRRRHRRWAGAVLAAAAVTVGGYSLTATGLLDGLTGGAETQTAGDSDSGSAADAAVGGSLAEEPRDGAARDRGSQEGAGAEALAGEPLTRGHAADGPSDLSSATLRRDAARLVSGRDLISSRKAQGGAAVQDSREAPTALRRAGCVPPPAAVRGRRTAVTYDGRPATAVVRRTPDGRADVALWDCESPTRLARVVVPR